MFTNYGALFLGDSTPVPLGDYAAGPNHTLPTSGAARYTGGLTPFTFLRPQAWVRNRGTELPELAAKLANMEGLTEHEEAFAMRAKRKQRERAMSETKHLLSNTESPWLQNRSTLMEDTMKTAAAMLFLILALSQGEDFSRHFVSATVIPIDPGLLYPDTICSGCESAISR